MWPDHFYLTELGKGAYVIYAFVTVVVAVIVYQKLLSRLQTRALRFALLAALTLPILLAPLWDVYQISMEAKQLCSEQAGMHVYRTVEAEGFIGDSGIEMWSKHGYRYIESGGVGNRKFRESMRNGKAVTEEVTEFTSDYQLQTGVDERLIGNHFKRSSARVIDRQTQEVFGELVTVSIYPGWLDQISIGLTGGGSGFSPWQCGNQPPQGGALRLGGTDVVLATIKPHKLIQGETK